MESCSTLCTSYLNSSRALLLLSDQRLRQRTLSSMTRWRLGLELVEELVEAVKHPLLLTPPLRTRRLTLRTSS